MNIKIHQLEADLKIAGINVGDILVVHSSLKSIGMVDGGPETVINALHSAVGKDGGLVFPCLTFSGSVTEFLRNTQCVDLRNANITTGSIPRAAWNFPGVFRSIHPTHPVAGLGRKAREIVSGPQSGQGPCGTDSPFYKAATAGAKILLIGVNNSSNTTLHCIEELHSPYIFPSDVFDIDTIDFDGKIHKVTVRGYCIGVARKFLSIEQRLIDEKIMTVCNFGQAEMQIIDAKLMIDKVSDWVREEPWLLAEKSDE